MKNYLEKILIIFIREFNGYFRTPLASIFLLVFLALSSGMCFFMGQFFQRGQAEEAAPPPAKRGALPAPAPQQGPP